MDFPAKPAAPAEAPPELERALDMAPAYTARSDCDWLVLVESKAAVRSLEPDLAVPRQIPARGFIITAPAMLPGVDFVSRFIAHAAGVDEDPVTGSAHCTLGPFSRGRTGRDELTGSPRGGTVRVRVMDERVALGGRALTVRIGFLFGPQAVRPPASFPDPV